MKYSDFEQLIKKEGLNIAYHSFGKAQPFPYLCYLDLGNGDLMADNEHYYHIKEGHLELYTEEKDEETEQKIEDLLKVNEIPYEKMGTIYIEKEKMFETIYNIYLI